MNFRLLIAVIVIASFNLSGCTYNKGLVVSSADRGATDKVVGVVRGQAGKDYLFFGLIQTGDDSLGAAFIDAVRKSKVPAQGLINVFAEKYCTYYLFPIFWTCGTSLTGTAIQYAEIGEKILIRAEDIPTAGLPDPSFGDCKRGEALVSGKCLPITPH